MLANEVLQKLVLLFGPLLSLLVRMQPAVPLATLGVGSAREALGDFLSMLPVELLDHFFELPKLLFGPQLASSL